MNAPLQILLGSSAIPLDYIQSLGHLKKEPRSVVQEAFLRKLAQHFADLELNCHEVVGISMATERIEVLQVYLCWTYITELLAESVQSFSMSIAGQIEPEYQERIQSITAMMPPGLNHSVITKWHTRLIQKIKR